MAQNLYDDDGFFAGYARLPRSMEGLAGAPEWPALRALLPNLCDSRVLDLGCGYGWFCRWARGRGARAVLGIDVSEKMLARAAADTSDPAIAYRRADLETVELPPDAFDLVYSSLAFHYLADLDRLFGKVHRALAPGGHLVFSAEHPLYTAPFAPGWSIDAGGQKRWPVDHYLDEGKRTPEWLGRRVEKYHRTLASWIMALLAHGFRLRHVEEWRPTDAQIGAQPSLADERHRPMFMIVAALR